MKQKLTGYCMKTKQQEERTFEVTRVIYTPEQCEVKE
jgi:hypothetical protein